MDSGLEDHVLANFFRTQNDSSITLKKDVTLMLFTLISARHLTV